MRLCVPIPCFFENMPLYEAILRVKALGFDAAETYGWEGEDLEKAKNACEETGVELLSMCTSEFCMTDPKRRAAWLEGLKKSCEAAKKLGVRRLITQSGSDTGAPREIQHASIAAALEQAKPILEEYGMTLMLEPLNTLVDHPDAYLWSSKEAFQLIREAHHPLIKMVFDIYHQQIMEGNIIPNITESLDCIAHLHAAGHPGRHELQNGESNYNVIFRAIDRAGYRGACGLEYSPLMNPEESLSEAKKIYGK